MAAWSGNFKHKQDFGHGLTLLGNAEVLSNAAFNETYDLSQVDVAQQRSFLSLQDNQADHSWSLQASETQTLQSIPDGNGGILSQNYVISDRQLPTFQYTRYSKPLAEGSLLYWGFDSRVGRADVVPQLFITPTATTVFDEANAYYLDQASLTPNLSYTQRLTRSLSLNSNLNLSQAWQKQEGIDGDGQGVSTYGAFYNLQKRWSSTLTTSLGERQQRQLTQVDTLRWAGMLTNRIEARSNWQATEALSVLLSTYYDLLPYQVPSDLDRLDLIHLQTNYSPDADRGLSLSTGWHAPSGTIKTLDLNGNLNDRKQRWQTNMGLNWVNNATVPAPPSLDPNAPLQLSPEVPRMTPDQLLASARVNLVLSPKWHVSYYERLDLTSRRLDEQAFSLWRDLSCIDTEIYARETVAGGWQYGFALSLSALPSARVSSNQITNDLFQPVQFGY